MTYLIARFREASTYGALTGVLAALGLQIGLGIANVLLQLPLPLAVAHNTGAALLLCATLAAASRVFTRSEARGRFPAAGLPRRFQAVR